MLKRQIDVIKWWHGTRNYSAGIQLLTKYSKNLVVVRTLARKSQHFGQRKLEYELTKAVGLDFNNMPLMDENLPVEEEQHETAPLVNPISLDNKIFIQPDDVPDIIGKITKSLSGLYNDRSKLHGLLQATGTANDDKSVSTRAFLVSQILKISDSIDRLFSFVHLYKEKKLLPPANADLTSYKYVLEPEPVPQNRKPLVEKLPESLVELKKMKKHFQVLNSKDRNLLLYQNRVSQKVENPMPAGARRATIEKRIELRCDTIVSIDEQIGKLYPDAAKQ